MNMRAPVTTRMLTALDRNANWIGTDKSIMRGNLAGLPRRPLI
ncbi:MAG: hypothetical protein R2857_10290 [Vampirovibrionales bacterium]